MNQIDNSRNNTSNSSIDSRGHIYTVSTFTSEIKEILESTYPFIWIKGEVSNFKKAVSGHFYFTLKDDKAQINAVMFRNQNRHLKFEPENGMMLIGFGRLSLYEPRGSYQIIFEFLEPEGKGALIAAFEQLKARLAEEGLFNDQYKSPLPFLPKKIGLITSPKGAVVHDLINILTRRYPNMHIEIIPAKVQGDGAEHEIVSSIQFVNSQQYPGKNAPDVIILARGGGSLEDMHAFNSEIVARAVYHSNIPIISAIGHETDYTIADFVSDFRAPTPSAAAEIAVPVKNDLIGKLIEQHRSLNNAITNQIKAMRSHYTYISGRLITQSKKITDLRMRIEDIILRLKRVLIYIFQKKRSDISIQSKMLLKNSPLYGTGVLKEKIKQDYSNLFYFFKNIISHKRSDLAKINSMLMALNPTSILSRGYSIIRTIEDKNVVKDSETVRKGQELEVVLAKGKLIVKNI